MMRFFPMIALALGLLASPAAAQPVRTDNVEAELHSARAAVAPGETFTIVLRQTIREHWHTYWRNPGDSGEATELTWTSPQGARVGEIQWPAPEAIPFAMLVNYGYSGEVLFPIEVTAPANARPGETLTFTADAYWLVCSDVCIPEEAQLLFSVPVTAQGADNPDWSARIGEAVAASRDNVETMTHALKSERDAVVALNGDLKDQTETIAHSIGRQVRLLREASKMVKTEVVAAEDALESHLASFTASATVMGERTAHFHVVADKASAATWSLNGAMTEMLEGLAQATLLTETAKKATAEAVLAANETAGAVRETTRTAVFEAKRAAQLIRAESVAMQEAASDTLAKLQSAASAARAASVESEAAADRYTATIEKRLNALASTAGAKKVSVQRQPEPAVMEEATSLHAAARVAVARGAGGGSSYAEVETQPKRAFKGFGSWGNFMPPQQREEEIAPTAANEGGSLELASFGNADDELRAGAINLVINSGVDIDDVLAPVDLDRIARSSRDGATARRRAVVDAAPGAVGRISRHMKRNANAQELAAQFRSRPDLAKSEKKGEGSDLVRAYLLIDAALAS